MFVGHFILQNPDGLHFMVWVKCDHRHAFEVKNGRCELATPDPTCHRLPHNPSNIISNLDKSKKPNEIKGFFGVFENLGFGVLCTLLWDL